MNYYYLPNSVHRISEELLAIRFTQVKASGLANGWTFSFWLSECGYIPVDADIQPDSTDKAVK